MSFDLENLRLLGWALLGIALLGLMLCEGLNMGVSMLLPLPGNSETDKLALIRRIAPTSLGSLVWLLTLLAIVFAGWPIVYAVTLAGFYPLLLLVVLALMLRPLLVYFADDLQHSPWQRYLNRVLTAGGLLPAAMLGLLAGNLLKGIPFHLDSDMRILFLGDFAGLFNVFAMLAAATCVTLLTMYAAVFIRLNAGTAWQARAETITLKAGAAFLLFFIAAGLWVTHLEGYHISSEILSNQTSNPLSKFVKRGEGLWLDNYEHVPTLWAVPISACLGAIAAMLLVKRGQAYPAMLAASFCVVMVVLTFGLSLFPFLVPSNISLNSSLTLWDSSASRLSLQILLSVTAFAVPLMALYSRWVFGFFSTGANPRSPNARENGGKSNL